MQWCPKVWMRTLISTGVMAVLACQADQVGPPIGPPKLSRELAAALAPSAVAAIAPSGAFPTTLVDPSSGPQLSAAEAAAFATVFARNYAVHVKSFLESQRLGPIDFPNLTSCGRPLYAASPYRIDSKAAVYERNALGPRWFITMCSEGEPQLSIAVAAQATEMRVKDGRIITFPGPHGYEFVPQGIPVEWDGALPVSPEGAAVIAAQASGKRVVSAPRLVIADPGWVPHAAQWLIDLDGTVQVPGRGGAQRVFVGLRLDGMPALGKNAVSVQVPNGPGTPGPGHQPASSVLSRATLDPSFAYGWKTAFTPVDGGGAIK